jgi:predicted ATPase
LDADLAPLLSPAGAPAKAVDPEHALLREAAAIVALLRRLASEQPLLVILDDLHAADLASLDLLQLVASDLRGAPILIVGTYREVEARRNPRIAALLAKVGREGSVRPLGRLDRGAVTRWVEEVLGAAPPSLAEAVFGATEGNPLFVEAVVQLLAARGPDAELAPEFALPDTILAAVSELVARVSADAQPLLETAAVFGRDCSLAALEIALERPAEELRAAVTEGIAAGVLCAQPRPSSPVRFAHVLVREAIYQALPTPQRVALHARVARALGRLHAGDLDAHIAELAHHAFECAPAVPWLETADLSSRAGDRAMELLAFDDAARHFERALIALDHAESPDDLRRAELLQNLGVAEIRLGRGRAGRDHCERSAALAERAGRPELFARAALAFGVEIVPGRADPRLVELLETALRLGPVSTALRAQLLARLAAALTPTLHSERAAALAARGDRCRPVPGRSRRAGGGPHHRAWRLHLG